MKPFIFNEQEYKDLNSLGLAFVEHYDLALQCIKEKPWLKFFKNFKEHKKRIRNIFYQSRYLQNALSMIIYWITEEHIVYIGHQRYTDIAACLKDIRKNPAFYYFAEDHGFSNTIIEALEDEKLKADLKALEENYTDEFSFLYLEEYYVKDSLEQLHQKINEIPSAKDSFLMSDQVFTDIQVQLSLAHKYSLQEVLELRKQQSAVFTGLFLVKDIIDPLPIVEQAYYHFLFKNFKKLKYKGKEGKELHRNLKQAYSRQKKYAKWTLKLKMNAHEKLYQFYQDWVNLYYLNKVWIKEESMKPTVPYCHTFIPPSLQEEKQYDQEVRLEEYQPVMQKKYDLNQFFVSLRTHRNFAIWIMVLSFLAFVIYFALAFMDSLRLKIVELLAKLMKTDVTAPEEIASKLNLFFFIGLGIAAFIAIFILIVRMLEKKKYKKLCKLAYYRKHEAKLREHELKEYDAIKDKETKFVKQMDRYYRFYGGIGMAGFSLCIVISTLALIYGIAPVFYNELCLKVQTLIEEKLYFIWIAPALCTLLGFARHKKTTWSVLFTWLISLAAAVGLLFLV